ncbi:MAG: beta-ketoacyl-ACP synthase III [Pseudomonadota bacterium]
MAAHLPSKIMITPVISATGLWTPPNSVSNEELVEAFNQWAENWNAEHAAEIEAGAVEAQSPSSVEFIEKASGIKARYVINKDGIINPDTMRPDIPERPNEEPSLLAEMAVNAATQALESVGRDPKDVDAVLCACSNLQRAYPAISIEIQELLGIDDGFGFDMNVACSSATFGIQTAADMIRSGSAKSILVVNPEVCSAHLNFKDRDSHFIFGDVATAILLEAEDIAPAEHWKILGTHLKTKFSNNIRNNFGFLNNAAPDGIGQNDKLFIQEGRKVFKEVVPMVAQMIGSEMDRLDLASTDLKRLWLHQANANMNRLISTKVLGHEASDDESPTVLDTYANTSSAGSIIAFHKHSEDFQSGDKGLICSFGAGYSAGTAFVERVS